MRSLPLVAFALLTIPLVSALAPVDVYAGVDPVARMDAWQDPYDPAMTMACTLPMTLQVQRNAGGTWDVLARGVDAVPSPLDIASNPAIAQSSATNCATYLVPTLSVTNMAGSPSTGLQKTLAANTCYSERVQVSPFTVGGPTVLYYSYSYARACYGTGHYFGLAISPVAMG